MQKDARIVLDGRLEVHTDGSVYKIRPDGKIKASVTINRTTKQASVSLCENGRQKAYFVNRLVAEAFIPNPDSKPYVSYIDGDPSNNNVDNLMWITKTDQVAKARMTLKKKERNCSICGNITMAEDGICTKCKQDNKREVIRLQKENENMAQIRQKFANIDIYNLTYNQRRAVEMRLQGMVYDEIGAEMGCSKQCVRQYLNAALRKAGKERAADKAIIRDYMSTQSKLNKERNFLNNLVAEEELTRAKIQSLEQILLKYEEIYPEKLKMDPSGSRREGSRTK